LRNIGEGAVPIVLVEAGISSFKIHRRAIGALEPGEFVVVFLINFPGPENIVADEEVEQSVVVVIEPGCAGAPLRDRARDPGVCGDFLKLH